MMRESDYSNETTSHDSIKPKFIIIPLSTTVNLLSGVINITVSPSDANGIEKVEFVPDDSNMGTFTSAPYTLEFDTTVILNGNFELMVKVYDNAGNFEVITYQITINNEDTTTTTTTFDTSTTDTTTASISSIRPIPTSSSSKKDSSSIWSLGFYVALFGVILINKIRN